MDQNEIDIKNSIAEEYIKQFKKELDNTENEILEAYYQDIKRNIVSGNVVEDYNNGNLSFLDDIELVSRELANRVFDFIKEKQNEILDAETRGGLQELYDSIIRGENDESPANEGVVAEGDAGNTDATVAENEDTAESQDEKEGNKKHRGRSATVAAGVTLPQIDGYRRLTKHVREEFGKEIIKIVDDENKYRRTKDVMLKTSDELSYMAKYTNLDSETKALYEKYSQIYKEAAESMDENMIKLLNEFDDLEKHMGMTMKEISKMNLNVKFLEKLGSIDQEVLFSKIRTLEDGEIMRWFQETTGQKLPKEVLQQMKKARTAEELKQFTKTLGRVGKETKYFKVVKALKTLGYLDIICTGIDIYFLMDGLDEAKFIEKTNSLRAQYKRKESRAVFGCGLAMTIGSAVVMFCLSGGPLFWATGGILAVGMAGIDMLESYYAKRGYYAQNYYDYMCKTRIEQKNAIVNCIAEKEEKGEKEAWKALMMQETLYDTFSGLERQEIMILQYYIDSKRSYDDFVSKLDKENKDLFSSSFSKIDEILETKLEYIDKLKAENDERFKNLNVKDIGDISAEATTYYYMTKDRIPFMEGKSVGDDIKEYMEKFDENLKKCNSKYYPVLKKFYDENPNRFWILYDSVKYIKMMSENRDEDSKYNKSPYNYRIEFIINFGEYKKLGKSIEDRKYLPENEGGVYPCDLMDGDIDLRRGEQVLDDPTNIDKPRNLNQEEAIHWLHQNCIDNPKSCLTPQSTFQAILYEVARQVHGYTGENNMQSLMEFFTEENKGENGIYFDGERHTGDGRRIDNDKIAELDTKDFKDADEIYSNSIYATIKNLFNLRTEGTPLIGMTSDSKHIETVGATGDSKLSKDFNEYIYQISYEILSNRFPENREKIEKDILEYVKKYSVRDENGASQYIGLSGDIIEKCKYAGIGDISKFLFKYDKISDKVVMLTTGNNTGKCSFKHISMEAEELEKNIELGQDVKNLIAKVDELTRKIINIRDLNNNELDIPVPIQRLIGDKVEEWKNVKESFEYYDPMTFDRILNNIEKYYIYFSDLYNGILSTISTFSHTNDMNDCKYWWNGVFPWTIENKDSIGSNFINRFTIRTAQKSPSGGYLISGQVSGEGPRVDTIYIENTDYYKESHKDNTDGNNGNTTEEIQIDMDALDPKKRKSSSYYSAILGGIETEDGLIWIDDIDLGWLNNDIKLFYKDTILKIEDTYKDETSNEEDTENSNNTKKTIETLILEGNPRGYYLAREALRICLEKSLLVGNDVEVGKGKLDDMKDEIINEVKSICAQPDFGVLYQRGKYTELKRNLGQHIRKITKQEVTVRMNGQEVLDNIINTNQGKYDWRAARGGIKFERNESESKPDGSIIVGNIISRGHHTKIKYENGKISFYGISKTFSDTTEGLRTANLINFLKNEAKKYPRGTKMGRTGVYRCYQWSVGGDLERNLDYYPDTNIVENSTVKSKFPSIYKDETFMKELNNVIFGIYTA